MNQKTLESIEDGIGQILSIIRCGSTNDHDRENNWKENLKKLVAQSEQNSKDLQEIKYKIECIAEKLGA